MKQHVLSELAGIADWRRGPRRGWGMMWGVWEGGECVKWSGGGEARGGVGAREPGWGGAEDRGTA